MKKLLVLTLVLTGAFTLGACESDEELNSLEQIYENGELILGLDDTFAPMGFKDEDGNVVGFDIDLAQAVADALGRSEERRVGKECRI